MECTAVIGMNYGDEGKGHIVDYLCSQKEKALVIRFNGGGQAGHHVASSDGRYHTFHHFGSGTLRNAYTLLSRDFIINPIIFRKEFITLSLMAPKLRPLIDVRCLVTTPYDMMINRYSSFERNARDTVGAGINETVERSKHEQITLTIDKYVKSKKDVIHRMLWEIENEWIPFRLNQLGLSYKNFMDWVNVYSLLFDQAEDRFMEYIEFMLNKSTGVYDYQALRMYKRQAPTGLVVFEGAQGLLLDQNRRKDFPYLTRSNTGVTNITKVFPSWIPLKVILVTRAYLTRHGDGPMLNEQVPFGAFSGISNRPNEFQGTMRYGLLDKKWYHEAINKIKKKYPVSVAVTCMDQMEDGKSVQFSDGAKVKVQDLQDVSLVSSGIMECDVKECT